MTTDIPLAEADERAEAVAIQSDGKIVIAANGGDDQFGFGVLRYDSGGALDPSFGGGGMSFVDFVGGFVPAAFAMAIQSDGKIIAAGTTTIVNIDARFLLARFQAA